MRTTHRLKMLIIVISIAAVLLSPSVRADEDDEDDEEVGDGSYYSQPVDPGYSYQQPGYQPNYADPAPSPYPSSGYPGQLMQDGYSNPTAYGDPNAFPLQAIESVVVGLFNGPPGYR